MIDPHFENDSPAASSANNNQSSNLRDAAGQAYSKASEMARDAGDKVKQAASDTASTVSENVKELLDRQVGIGADMAGQFASSIKLAADDLDREAPMLAGLVRGFANTVDGYAEGLQDQTVEQLTQRASDFTRRQPALVLGLAAVAGFFMFRTWKSAQPVSSPSIQPMQSSSAEHVRG
jgi:ElaB/YqjD/DUF883 family membrane-anchored ribosome-binding protein